VEKLRANGKAVSLKLYGEGIERANLESYITKHQLHNFVSLEGNQSRETINKPIKTLNLCFYHPTAKVGQSNCRGYVLGLCSHCNRCFMSHICLIMAKRISIRFGFRKDANAMVHLLADFAMLKDLETMQVDGLENILWNILKLKLNPIAPMRILQLIDSLEAGGAERMVGIT
jgi:hypothetical protein